MTRDEFTDIMGGIDERLIDSALNSSQPEMVEVVYERPPVLRYIMGIAACIALLVTTVIAVPYFKGVLPQPNDSSGSAGSSVTDKPDIIRGWDPEELVYNEFGDFLYIGANARVFAAELDGITAELILHNIKKEPGKELVNELTDFDYTDYIGAEDIVLYIHDDKGRRFIEPSVTPHSYNDMEFISMSCLFDDCTRLYKTDNSEYVLMQYADYNSEQNALIASFYNVDLKQKTLRDENGIYDASDWRVGIVGNRRIGGWQYGYQASKEFEYTEAKFQDLVYEYEIFLGERARVIYPYEMPEGYKDIDINNITGWDPDKLTISEGQLNGAGYIAFADSADGITATLILDNIIKRPGERHYIYSEDKYLDMWAADDVYLYITDTDGRRVLLNIPTPLSDGSVKFIPSSCLFNGCILILRTTDSTNSFFVMMYLSEKDGKPVESFIQCNLERYVSDFPRDENGISLGGEPNFVDITDYLIEEHHFLTLPESAYYEDLHVEIQDTSETYTETE